MRYSFDRAKQAINLKKHGFDLADAPVVIESGETVTFEDRRFAYGEERFVTLVLRFTKTVTRNRVFTRHASLQILAIPPGIAAVCA